jgi:hypothetical protein
MGSTTIAEKHDDHKIEVVGHQSPRSNSHDDGDVNNVTGKHFEIDEMNLPDGYFKSLYFWGSMVSIGLSVSCGVAGFSFVAPILSFINADIGPSPDINWVALSYTLTGSVGLMLVGRLTGKKLSDIIICI